MKSDEAERATRRRLRSLAVLLATGAALTLAACSSGGRSPSEPAPPQPATANFGYAGPSVVTRIGLGVTETFPDFRAWDGRALRDLNGAGFDGCDVFRWARLDDSSAYCWNNFEQMLQDHPGTDRLLFMVAFKPGQELGVAETRAVARELLDLCSSHRPAGDCELLVSGLPDYVDTCGEMPINGVPELTRSVAATVADTTPGMTRGPTFSPVSAEQTTDGCHQDGGKRSEHATELLSHLGEA